VTARKKNQRHTSNHNLISDFLFADHLFSMLRLEKNNTKKERERERERERKKIEHIEPFLHSPEEHARIMNMQYVDTGNQKHTEN
jgi:hypothetical protein